MSWLDDFVRFSAGQLDERQCEALWARGVTDEQIRSYMLGYIDRKLPDLPYPKSFLDWSCSGSKLEDVFVLPLNNALGEVKGVQFRSVVRSKTGYMDFFADKSEPVLFGLAQAMPHIWETGEVYVVEGGFDLFPIQRIVPGTLATLTARVTEPLVILLRRLVRRMWLGYDNDSTGCYHSSKFAREHKQDFDIHVVTYPKIPKPGGGLTKDPGELWETWGEVQFRNHMRSLLRSSLGLEFAHA